jgi:hypothetical protein
LQERISEALLGRVFGFVYAIASAAMPLGMLVAGLLLQYACLRITILIETSMLLIVALSLLGMRSLRELDELPVRESGFPVARR